MGFSPFVLMPYSFFPPILMEFEWSRRRCYKEVWKSYKVNIVFIV